MHFAFIIDPLESLKAYKDTTVCMMREAQARGHAVWVCQQDEIAWRSGVKDGDGAGAAFTRLWLEGGDDDWYRVQETRARRLAEFDAVVMRKDPPFDLDTSPAPGCSKAEREALVPIGRAACGTITRSSRSPNTWLRRPTLVTRDPQQLHAFIDAQRDVVLKRLDVMGGENIFRVRADDPNRNVIIEIMAAHRTRSVMAQRYIPEISEGDKRVLLIGGKPVPHCLARIPKAGESRGNLAAGGRGEARPLGKREREIANALGAQLAARGLLLVGLDVIGVWLTEINVTSPTCFREIQDQTGFNVAGMFLDALEAACRVPRGKRA